jgi:hypothetical protein
MDLPHELKQKILLMATPNYSYMTELKQVHNLIHKFSEDYYDFSPEVYDENCEIAHKFGLHKWFEHYRMVRDEPYMTIQQEIEMELIEAQQNANGW